VLGVALAVALVVAVTGVALWPDRRVRRPERRHRLLVVPEQSTAESVAVSSGGVKLGDVHAVSERIERDERVDYATPVALSVVPVTDRTTGRPSTSWPPASSPGRVSCSGLDDAAGAG